MTVAASLFRFEDSYARAVPGLSVPWTADSAPAAELLVLNEELAVELGVDPAALREPSGVALLVGQLPEGLRRSPRPTPAISSASTCPASGTAARCCSAR
jgi:protein adenylyltransferase